jgi:hypothetical protein
VREPPLFPPGSARLGTVTLRGAPADGAAARLRLARALDRADWSVPGLPPSALLVVRRVTVGGRAPGPAGAQPFPARVTGAVRQAARDARRPWVHGDTASAAAVVFVDEAELAACLVRDWLRGAVAERWWWRGVLHRLGAREWLRARVLARGEVLVPALALLAERGEAVAWAARLSPAEADEAAEVVARTYALAAPGAPGPAGGADPPSVRTAALARVLAAVPEARSPGLNAPQRRLLAAALAVAREPAWARGPQLAPALRALDDAASAGLATVPGPSPGKAADQPAPPGAAIVAHPPAARAHAAGPDLDEDADPAAPARAAHRDGTDHAAHGDGVAHAAHGGGANRTAGDVSWHPGPTGSRRGDAAERARHADPPAPRGAGPAPSSRGASRRYASPATELPDAVDATDFAPSVAAADEVRPAPVYEQDFGSQRWVETEFGGIFYLLNAALALELYGDFTMPRAKGLALLPWDWLALVGRAWFGAELVRDGAWALLAALAGRRVDEPPGADFQAPREWMIPAEWLAPWGAVDVLRVHATRARLRVLHPAGFALIDVPRDPARRPLA